MLDANWHAAEAEARRLDGHLATIRNARELEWLRTRFESYPLVWIGLQNAKRELDWKWISGERAPFTNWDQGPSADARDRCFALLATGSGWQARYWRIRRLQPWIAGFQSDRDNHSIHTPTLRLLHDPRCSSTQPPPQASSQRHGAARHSG